jgi:hypothetical protein
MSAQQSAGNGGMLGLDHARGHTYSPKPGGYARDRSAPLERWMNRIGLRLASLSTPLAARRLADREHQAAFP